MNNSIIEHKFFLILIIAFLIFIAYIFLFSDISPTTARLLEREVVLASGVSLEEKELVVINPETGNLELPCRQIQVLKYKKIRTGNNANQVIEKDLNSKDCEVEIVSDSNSELADALEISKKTIEGQVRKGDKLLKAIFVVEVKGAYEGSTCNTSSSQGNQIENCGRKRRRP